MKVSKEEVKHIAELARLNLEEGEEEKYSQQLSQVLEWADKLNNLDVDKLEPTAHVLEMKNVTRADSARETLSNEKALANAPDKEDGYFKVPRIIE